MGMRINTNVSSLAAQRSLIKNKNALNANLRKLSTGHRITRASDDAAGLAISENFKSFLRATRQAQRNAGDSISMIQTAEGALEEISNIVIRLRELAIQTSSDTISDKERKFSNIEFLQLVDEVKRISKSTSFNENNLLDGTSGVLEFQIGQKNDPNLDRLRFDFTQADSTPVSLGIETLDISTKLGSQNSLANLDGALKKVNGIRALMGATQNRLQSVMNNLSITDENISAANSRIRDLDIAAETADLAKNNILVQSGVSVLSQANNSTSMALKLIN
ncbi:MAG: flagellin FliC [Halobacteriovoraceae bacterium]|nr:flagellin FliC [Halobacteriovoraceae bacterium]